MLLDRREELEALDRLLRSVRQGFSATLVIRGEPGIGKTALLQRVVESSPDFRVARVEGVESELEFAFAGLHHLLLGFLPQLDALPVPQRRALRAAFGLVGGGAPDRFLVGLATLTLLADAAVEQPLLVLVDDAQWLDRESAGVLGFVARRLQADRIAVLFAARGPGEAPGTLEGLPELPLGGLPESDALELLRSRVEGRLDDRVGERILDQARGNPLALIEFARALTPAQLAGRSLPPDPLPLGGQLEEHFGRQVRKLPAEARTLLLLAAAQTSSPPELFWRAAKALGLDPEVAGGEAERHLAYTPRVVFRHPLGRSATYGQAPMAERRSVHAALAEASDPEHDPDRRAWHRAMAAIGPDEGVAQDLERSAGRARERGGYGGAATFLARAAELTPDERGKAARLLGASQAELAAGDLPRAEALLSELPPLAEDRFQHGQALRLRGAIDYARGQLAETPSMLMRAAEMVDPFDPCLARATILEAMQAALYAGRLGKDGGLLAVAGAARAAPRAPASRETAADALLEGFSRLILDGYAPGVPGFRRAIDLLAGAREPPEECLRWLMLGCLAAGVLWDDEAEHRLANRWVQLARDLGALTTLPVALNYLGWYEVQAGRVAAAESLLLEQREIAAATGNAGVVGPRGAGDLLLLAWCGREPEARDAAAAMKRDCIERGQGAGVVHAQSALTLLELGLGRYRDALWCAIDVYEEDLPYLGTLVLPDLVEAAARSGEQDVAASALDRLSKRARASGTSRALGLVARCRALLAGEDDAGLLYGEAVERLQGPHTGPELARAHLLFGEWLRRRRRRLEARDELRQAYEMLDAMGATAFAERARVELLATGGRARRRTVDARSELTPQEARIARLASDGLPNAEIAARLFVSASTVEYHLGKVFRKVGVTSRTQLHAALPDRRRRTPAAT